MFQSKLIMIKSERKVRGTFLPQAHFFNNKLSVHHQILEFNVNSYLVSFKLKVRCKLRRFLFIKSWIWHQDTANQPALKLESVWELWGHKRTGLKNTYRTSLIIQWAYLNVFVVGTKYFFKSSLKRWKSR